MSALGTMVHDESQGWAPENIEKSKLRIEKCENRKQKIQRLEMNLKFSDRISSLTLMKRAYAICRRGKRLKTI